MNKLKILTSSIILSLTLLPIVNVYADSEYKDLSQDHWAYKSVNIMTDKKIAKGYQDGTFKPNSKVTYAEFIKMVDVAATGRDVGNYSNASQWYRNYYEDAVKNGMFNKGQIEYADMYKSIPRKDMALIISNTINVDYDSKLANNLSDVNSNDSEILEAYGSGIITGYPDGTFKAYGVLTRAESATVLYRLVDESKRVIPTVRDTNTVHYDDVHKVITDTSVDKDVTATLKGYKYADANKYTWKKLEGGGIKIIDCTNSNGQLGSLYWYKDNKLTKRITQQNGLDGTVTICYYSNQGGDVSIDEREEARTCKYIGNYHCSTGVMELFVNPLYNNI